MFYFTAEERVDFRELVRELASEYKTRIELRQIGVRDEAKLLTGYGTCGRPLCCSDVPEGLRPDLDQDGQAAGPRAESVAPVRAVRPAQVLSPLRTAPPTRRTRARHRDEACPAAHDEAGGCGGVCGEPATGADGVWRRPRMTLPRIAITVGDPAGIGPEIARQRAWPTRVSSPSASPWCTARPTVPRCRAGPAVGRGRPGGLRHHRPGGRRTPWPGAWTAIATAPINKEAFALAGLPWHGHTELLAHLTGASSVAMMFYAEALRVVLATIHVPLADVPAPADARRTRAGRCG